MNRPYVVAPELVACIADGRAPKLQELGRMAEGTDREIHGNRPLFAWGASEADVTSKWIPYRLAHAALVGTDGDADRMPLEDEVHAIAGVPEMAGADR